jgi:crotonobetainyl-CoA:carnitine CoA-transferase CaiB-like acyl-CoA transferase
MQFAHDGAWLQELDGMRLAPNPILVDGERTPLRIPPPRYGEHTHDVLQELGFDASTIDRLYASGVVR